MKLFELLYLYHSLQNASQETLIKCFSKLDYKQQKKLFECFFQDMLPKIDKSKIKKSEKYQLMIQNREKLNNITKSKLEIIQKLNVVIPKSFKTVIPLCNDTLALSLSYLNLKDKHNLMLTHFHFYFSKLILFLKMLS